MSEEILEKVNGLLYSLREARLRLYEAAYANRRMELTRDFERLKNRADLIADQKGRTRAYRKLALLEQLLTDPPAYSLKIYGVHA